LAIDTYDSHIYNDNSKIAGGLLSYKNPSLVLISVEPDGIFSFKSVNILTKDSLF